MVRDDNAAAAGFYEALGYERPRSACSAAVSDRAAAHGS